MNEKKYAVPKPEGSYISAAAIDRLIASGDPGAALFYLYLLRRNEPDAATAAAELGKSTKEIEAYGKKLEELGLLKKQTAQQQILPPPEEIPEYTSKDISDRAMNDGGFQTVVEEAQQVLGRMLSGADLKILYGIYDYLGLPAEVILLLINYCVARSRENQGPGRTPTMRTIEKEAYSWANQEILTIDLAEEHLGKLKARGEALSVLKRELGVYDREFTATERNYAESWLEMGFTPEALAIAYDRTIVRKGKRIWPYMDSIIRSWHERGLHTPEEIEAGDGSSSQQKKPAQQEAGQGGKNEDAEYLKKIFDKMGIK